MLIKGEVFLLLSIKYSEESGQIICAVKSKTLLLFFLVLLQLFCFNVSLNSRRKFVQNLLMRVRSDSPESRLITCLRRDSRKSEAFAQKNEHLQDLNTDLKIVKK